MTTLILVRHGETHANHDGIFAGWTDVELRNKGREQAHKTAQYIAESYKVDRIYASDLKRANETGAIIARYTHAPMETDMKLREVFGGIWEGVKFDELVARYPDEYGVWLHDIGMSHCPEGESVQQMAMRVYAALKQIVSQNEGSTIVIATHATCIRAMQCVVTGTPFEKMKDIPWVSNASVTQINVENGEWSLAVVGYDAHLGELITHLPKNV